MPHHLNPFDAKDEQTKRRRNVFLVSQGPSAQSNLQVREVWMKWGRWLVKCIEPKGQPGLHLLAVHGLLLMLKRSTNESSILKSAHLAELQLAQSSFFQNLLQARPRGQGLQKDVIYERLNG